MHTKYGEDVSTSTIDNSCKALREYGYNSTVTSHHYATVEKQLKNKMPVFMMGIKPGEKIGHAWVCDGFLSDTENAHYEVMVIDKTTMDMENRPYYRCVYNEDVTSINVLLHMNLGWYGGSDGYYQDASLRNIGYTEKRKDIINIHP